MTFFPPCVREVVGTINHALPRKSPLRPSQGCRFSSPAKSTIAEPSSTEPAIMPIIKLDQRYYHHPLR
ncbi:hypothetical protein LR48_Vigan05g124400 [Vigna angularis]|uniref:Uncharacterized protein n=1 Tax=Phaseolus angularis TaxID=3914 RepID=A0A0L9UM70_PHAAN|nr:hypothetical protein LR48_Vigan05g124400 [Vigna angularis]